MVNSLVLGPEAPAVDKIRNYYIQHILIKLDSRTASMAQNKQIIAVQSKGITTSKEYKNIYLVIDVDPLA